LFCACHETPGVGGFGSPRLPYGDWDWDPGIKLEMGFLEEEETQQTFPDVDDAVARNTAVE
jgi:hypothetical protein